MLNNFQGQPLTPIERAYGRSTPGFAAMLGSVQQFATKVEENRRIAEERAFQQKRDTTQFNRQIEMVTFQHGLQSQSQQELQQQKAQADLSSARLTQQIRREDQVFGLELQASDLGVAATAQQSYAQTLGTEDATRPRRTEQRIDDLNQTFLQQREKHPSIPVYQAAMGVNGDMVIERFDPNTGAWYKANMAEFQEFNTNAAQLSRIADSIQAIMQGESFPPEIKGELLELSSKVRSGQLSTAAAEASLATIVNQSSRETETSGQRTERIATTRQTANTLFTAIMPNPQTGRPATGAGQDLINRLTRSNLPARLPVTDEMRNDAEISGILSNNTDPRQAMAALTEHINLNYASLQTLYQAANELDYGKLDRQGNPADANKYMIHNNLNAVMADPGTGSRDEARFFNSFARTNDPNQVVTASILAQELVRRYNEGTFNPTPSTEQAVQQKLKQTTGW